MTAQNDKVSFGIDHRSGELVIGRLRLGMPRSRVLRIVIGCALIFGGLLGFLPVLGFWMIPLGLLVLSHDLAFVRRQRRKLAVWWEKRKVQRKG